MKRPKVWISVLVKATPTLAALSLLVVPKPSEAHIKWFCAYDTTVPPLPLGTVLTPAFLAVAGGFASLMFVAYLIDYLLDRSALVARIERVLSRRESFIPVLIRAATGAFFVSLWTGGNVILTPELKTTHGIIAWIQLAIAAAMLFRSTLILGAGGIIGLYLYGVSCYGAFHMMDYPIFVGLAVYLFCCGVDSPWADRLRLPALYFNVALTMMWGAIEKFGYPYWTFPLLETHQDLTFGLPYGLFMIVAGFVEYSIAFFILTGTALIRLASLALMLLLVSAVPEFGKVDAIGHSLIVVGLIAIIIVGQRGTGGASLLRGASGLSRSLVMTGSYAASLAALFVLYYGAQYAAGR